MIRVRSFFLFVSLLACVLAPLRSEGEDESTLDRINRQVEEQKAQLEEVSARQAVIEKGISKQQSEIGAIRSKEESLLAELKEAENQRLKAQQDIEQGEKRLASLKELSMRRLKALYMHRSDELLETLLFKQGSSSVARNALFLRKVREFDQKLMAEILLVVKTQGQKRIELEGLAKKKNQILASLSSQRLMMEKKLRNLDVLNRELKKQKEKINQWLTALRAQALRLETVVVSLTGGEEESEEKFRDNEIRDASAGRSEEPFQGLGLFREKGSLVLPVHGKVLQSYGRQKISDFEDMIFSKGIEYSAAAGSEVQAITRGKVMHVGRMPGYGTIIILDHGQRYYSLYGRLGKTLAGRGQVVEKGEIIAQTGEMDAKSRNFYFEIRRNGSPVNPQDYFKRL